MQHGSACPLAPAVAEIDILVDVGLMQIDQPVLITLSTGQQGAHLLDDGLPPFAIGATKELLGFLPRQVKPVQGSTDGLTAAEAAKPRPHKRNQALEGPARLRVSAHYGWYGGSALRGADCFTERGLDLWAKRGRPPVR